MMKKLLTMALAVGVLSATGLAGPAESKANSPMKRLEQAYAEIGQGDHKEALKHLTWCYDQGAKEEVAFVGIRNTYVVDTLAVLGKTYPPAKDALVTRRDAAMAKIGDPPQISLALFDVIALNRALGETQKNKDILAKCGQDASVKKFASAVMDASPTVGDSLDSVVSAETTQQANETYIASQIEAVEASMQAVEANILELRQKLERHRATRRSLEATRDSILQELLSAPQDRVATLVSRISLLEVEIARVVGHVIPEVEEEIEDENQRMSSLESELAHWQAELERATG